MRPPNIQLYTVWDITAGLLGVLEGSPFLLFHPAFSHDATLLLINTRNWGVGEPGVRICLLPEKGQHGPMVVTHQPLHNDVDSPAHRAKVAFIGGTNNGTDYAIALMDENHVGK